MLFSIDEDTGDQIICWVMPDNPSATPRISLHLNPDHHVVIEAMVYRPLLKQQGLHNTGICGFVVNEENCPGLGAADTLKIYDSDQNVLIYRRCILEGCIRQKFLRLEPQLLRWSAIDDAINARFQMSYTATEQNPEETLTSILAIGYSPSVSVSGRLFYRTWEPQIRVRGFKVGMLLREPFEELAERILLLRWISMPQAADYAATLGPVLGAAAKPLRNLALDNVTALNDTLANLEDSSRRILYNPLTFQLAAPNAFEPPAMPGAASALDSLADLDVVGLRDDPASFMETLDALFDLETPLPVPEPPISRKVQQMADVLREVPAAADLLKMDLDVYSAVARAVAANRGASAAPAAGGRSVAAV